MPQDSSSEDESGRLVISNATEFVRNLGSVPVLAPVQDKVIKQEETIKDVDVKMTETTQEDSMEMDHVEEAQIKEEPGLDLEESVKF